MDDKLGDALDRAARDRDLIVVLTGAGISAESGIPTFRGKDGFWTRGSTVYTPEEIATREMFERTPETVWPWYLYRRAACLGAAPNRAHVALARLDREMTDEDGSGGRVRLLTQNVDGLHARAGSPPERTWHIHGDIHRMRCAAACGSMTWPVPEVFDGFTADGQLDATSRRLLTCRKCGAWARPHVLWFDECYDEENYRFESSQGVASRARLLLIVGTAGATNLPQRVAALARNAGATIIDVNPEGGPFAELALSTSDGHAVRGTACEWVPRIVQRLLENR